MRIGVGKLGFVSSIAAANCELRTANFELRIACCVLQLPLLCALQPQWRWRKSMHVICSALVTPLTFVAGPGHTDLALNLSKASKKLLLMCPPVTGFSPKESRNGNQEILSSQHRSWASHRVLITATCLLFVGISYWLQWPYYSALLSLPLPHIRPLLDIRTDITGPAILAIRKCIQAQNLPSMPSNGNALWYKNEARNWVREYLPIGNGYLGGESSCNISTRSSYVHGSFWQRWCLAV